MTSDRAPSAASARPLVAVTGAARGVGAALVDPFLAAGWSVIACVRDANGMPAREHVHVVEGGLSDPQGAHALAHALSARFPTLRGLVNNAGVQFGPDETPAERAEQVQVNLLSPVELTHALLPVLERNGGFVANVSSGLAYLPQSRSPVYGATKAALSQFTRSQRLASPGVRFHEVLLPLVDTDMTRGRGSGKIPPEDAARAIVRGIERGDATIGVGRARMLPMMLRVAPGLLARAVERESARAALTSAPSRG